MNTGFLGPAVATVLTVYGIETDFEGRLNKVILTKSCNSTYRLRYWNHDIVWCTSKIEQELQQYLPFTVLKRKTFLTGILEYWSVATVLTVYGIETVKESFLESYLTQVATVLTVYGIETHSAECREVF